MLKFCTLALAVLLLTGCRDATTVSTTTTITSPTPIFPTTTSGSGGTCATGTCGTPTCATGTCLGGGSPNVRLPEIANFSADNNRLTLWAGQGTFIRWDVSDVAAAVRIDPYPGNVGAVGFVFIQPTVTTTYTLTARNGIGTVQRTLTIFVTSD